MRFLEARISLLPLAKKILGFEQVKNLYRNNLDFRNIYASYLAKTR